MSNVIVATTTINLVELSNKINQIAEAKDFFETAGGWIITGITLSITILFMLFLAGQWLYTRKIEEKRLEQLNAQIKSDVEKSIAVFLEEKLTEITTQIDEFKLSAEADIARLFALHSDKSGLFARGFNWWLSAAVAYKKIKSNDLCVTSINAAENILKKVSNGDSILKEDIDQIEESISFLASYHKTRMDLLRDAFHNKLKSEDTGIQK